ncbi:INO80 complex subunit E [Aplysia californica]|uniref:INO80 complex subunit E n=1 Tax=Aplysia californica TaxID=6500 RepID=A0ABM0JNG6_APLCA|nr:INO80 complex subunit E [Aplysia californica]XP_005097809.1 INO80 complex subunit E [Aplysia californica]
MMPVAEDFEDEFPEAHIDYKQKYKALKKKLRLLVYEQECFLEELRKAQRKLLKVSRDRSFLLDRLLQQEKIEDSSEESDATNSTDTEEGGHREAGPAKKRKLAAASTGSTEATHVPPTAAKHQVQGAGTSEPQASKKKSKTSGKKSSKSSGQKSSSVKLESPGHMTREELERHLESKQHEFSIEKATASLPMEIFSNDTNHDSDGGAEAGGEEEEDDLVIDVPH